MAKRGPWRGGNGGGGPPNSETRAKKKGDGTVFKNGYIQEEQTARNACIGARFPPGPGRQAHTVAYLDARGHTPL